MNLIVVNFDFLDPLIEDIELELIFLIKLLIKI